MKRIGFWTALALCVCRLFCATAESYTADGLFCLSYDEKSYTLDDRTYAEESDEGYRWLFMLYNDDVAFDVSLYLLENGEEELTLSHADEATRERYLEEMLDAYDDEEIELVKLLDGDSGETPFYLFRLNNEFGPYLMAETVVEGRAFNFMAYYTDSSLEADEALQGELEELLSGFALSEERGETL